MSKWTGIILRWRDYTGIKNRQPTMEELFAFVRDDRAWLEDGQRAFREEEARIHRKERPLTEPWDDDANCGWTDEGFDAYANDRSHHGQP